MNITPLDITQKQFRRVFRGLDPEEVEAFLALVASEFEALVKEAVALREESQRKAEEISEHRSRERALQETLVTAQKASEEIREAEEEGIRFEFLVAPVEVLGNEKKWVTGLRCVRMQLGEPDASGRARPIVIPGSEFVVPCDIVVVAISMFIPYLQLFVVLKAFVSEPPAGPLPGPGANSPAGC